MTRIVAAGCAAALLMSLLPGVVSAQTSATPVPGARVPVRQRGGEGPCLQQAGVQRSVWQQMEEIHRNAREQVMAICQNTSLTPQQQHQQIKQIHEQAQQQADALVTAQQRQQVEQCRAQRREQSGRAVAHVPHGGGGNPCAKVAMRSGQTTAAPQ